MRNIKINGLYFKQDDSEISQKEMEILIREFTRVANRHGFEFFGSFNRVDQSEANLLDLLAKPRLKAS